LGADFGESAFTTDAGAVGFAEGNVALLLGVGEALGPGETDGDGEFVTELNGLIVLGF